jgi:nicotinamide-nucleotide amidase
MKCFGIGESEVEVRMPDLIARDRIPRVGITASRATITLRIAAEGETEEECHRQIEPTRQEILERLGQLVFAEGEEELPETVLKQLIKRQQTLVTIEFGAAAFLGQWLSDAQEKLSVEIQHSSTKSNRRLIHGPYIGSMNSVTLDRLASSILVPRHDQGKSKIQEVASEAWRVMNCDWVLVVGPYPSLQSTSGSRMSEQGKSQQDLSAGHAAYDLDVIVLGENHLKHFNISMSGHPDVIQHRIAKTALDKLRYSLLSDSSSSAEGGDPPSDQSRR